MFLSAVIGPALAAGIICGYNFSTIYTPLIFIFFSFLWVAVYYINNSFFYVQKKLIPLLAVLFFLFGFFQGSGLASKTKNDILYEEFEVVTTFAMGYIIETDSKVRAYYIPNESANNMKVNNRYKGRIEVKPLNQTEMETKFRLMLYSRNVFNSSDIFVFGYAGARDIELINKIPLAIKGFIAPKLSPQAFSYTSALIFGDRSYFDRESINRILSLGILHLFAVSGMHVGILMGIMTGVCSFFKMTKRNSLIATILAMFIYCMLAGFAPSISRSTVMFSLLALSSFSGKFSNPLNTVFVSFLILLALIPHWIFSPGFQLSYMATFGIILYAGYMKDVFKKERFAGIAKFTTLFMISATAFIYTLPVQIYYFNTANALSIVFTPLFSVLITFYLAVSFIFIIVSPIPFLNEYTAFILDKTVLFVEFLTNASTTFVNFNMPENIAVTPLLILTVVAMLLLISIMFLTKKILFGFVAVGLSFVVFPIVSLISYLR